MEGPSRDPTADAGRPASEPANFDEIYRAEVAFVWRTLRRLGVPDSVLEDATQNVFLVVHRRLNEFEGRASFRTWVFRIAQRVASDTRRAMRRKGVVEPLGESLCAGGADPHESAERREALALLERMLDSLDDEKRAAFVLAELEGMTNPEIAEALGVNLNTVGSRLRAARLQFEKAVARHHKRLGHGR